MFVTTDPARDDEETVEKYVDAFDPSIIGLTGDLDDIIEVGRSMAVGVDQGEKLPSGGYEVTHGTQVIAIDADDDRSGLLEGRRLAGPAGPGRHHHSRRRAGRRMMSPMLDVLQSPMVTLMSIPSPSEGVWHLGPVPIRAYALCIIAGIVFAIWLGERRWVARGGQPGEVSDLAIWGVPFGLVGGRLYHVVTDWHLYFGEDKNPVTALYVWRGGLGIWGAIALGIVGIWIGARLRGIKLLPLLDALAPGRAGGAGVRPVGQLVQPGALRPPHRPARGAWRSTLRSTTACARSSGPTSCSTRRSSTSACGTSRRSRC